MRLFIGLDIEEAIRERIQHFIEGVQEFAPNARWLRPESLHVTLKFIGEKPSPLLEGIKQALFQVHTNPLDVAFRGYGFFPSPKAARVFWIGIESGPQLASLAEAVHQAMFALGIEKENHPFSPHLTLARAAGASGAPRRQAADRHNRGFEKLQEKLARVPSPEFGTMTVREFFLYQSQLSPDGSVYTKLERFALG
jgi:2'-5' RNA ligase